MFDALVCVFFWSLAVQHDISASTLLWTIREPSWTFESVRRVRPDPSRSVKDSVQTHASSPCTCVRPCVHACTRNLVRTETEMLRQKKENPKPQENKKPCGTESRCSVRGRFFQDLEVRRLPCQRQPIQSAAGSVSVTRSGRGLGAEMDAPAFRMPCEAPDKLKSALEICG
jgi:hypothetical protein